LRRYQNFKYNKLSSEEEKVIIQKGTEPAFTGKFDKHWEKGTYICRRCNTPLFYSSNKFNSHCGWPSFDDEILGAISRRPDPDGIRTEITCTECGAHLGHVFEGEGQTEKNTRHCVNSISLDFVPDEENESFGRAIFAGGCFWGLEYHFKRIEGVKSTAVGYTGGHIQNPTYNQVCDGSTGHAEAIEIIYNPKQVNYKELVKLFFEIHDPTQINRQGPDIGSQYRSEIFYLNENQKRIAREMVEILKEKGLKIATKITEAKEFWKAEDYHQDYYTKKGENPYCHVYTKRF
jgi:peptide methionine sulfoxide reductase msrA/msrB